MHLVADDRARFVSPAAFEAAESLRRYLRAGTILIGVLVFGFGTLAATIPIAGAVVAPGEIGVASHIKRIGHPAGGVVAGVFVREGEHVAKGQLLLRLDDTVANANARMTSESVDQLLAREARLTAERDGRAAITVPPALARRLGDPQVASLVREEQRVLALRRDARLARIGLLSQRIRQTEIQVAGYRTQAGSIDDRSRFVDQELAAARELWLKRYTTLQRLNQLEGTAVQLRGDAASAQTAAAGAAASIVEIRQQALSLDQDARSAASTELSDVQARLSELRQRKVADDDVSDRNALRAPGPGIVDKLAFATAGGVVPPGATIMEIVPDTDRLIVTARIRVSDVDQIGVGQPATLRFSAFNLRTTPEIYGTVSHVSADRIVDEKTGTAFYVARIAVTPDQLGRIGKLPLKPGMPVEVFVRTGERTMLSYIAKPLRDQIERAFRED